MKESFKNKLSNALKSLRSSRSNGRIIAEVAMIIIFIVIAINALSYKSYLKAYGSLISQARFSDALSLKENSNRLNPFKALFFEEDNTIALGSYLYSLKDSYNEEVLSEESFLTIIEELKPLAEDDKVLAVFKNNLPSVKEGQKFYNEALDCYEDKEYAKALTAISKISKYAPIYESSEALKKEVLSEYKNQVLEEAKKLEKKEYFTKGIEELQKYLALAPEDKEITSEIKKLEDLRAEYLKNKKTGASAPVSSWLSSVSAKDMALMNTTALEAYINTLSIDSKTPYSIWVNTSNQKTYILQKDQDKWSLLKSYPCSTGKEGHETPKGLFTMNGDRGLSFVNEEYKDGAKYWTRFNGVYLFHSVTYDMAFKAVKDDVLGEPRSHGCVRLKEEDAKWIYDNVKEGTTVVVI